MKDIEIKLNRINYILDLKLEILNQIFNITENQELFFTSLEGEKREEFLKEALKEKQILIDKINNLDNEFLVIFNSFNNKLNENKEFFKETLKNIKSKIKNITDLDFKIRVREEKNKELFMKKVPKIDVSNCSRNYLINKYKQNYYK